jgi:hypothetical protein
MGARGHGVIVSRRRNAFSLALILEMGDCRRNVGEIAPAVFVLETAKIVWRSQ